MSYSWLEEGAGKSLGPSCKVMSVVKRPNYNMVVS